MASYPSDFAFRQATGSGSHSTKGPPFASGTMEQAMEVGFIP
jgi:hypothetical protein